MNIRVLRHHSNGFLGTQIDPITDIYQPVTAGAMHMMLYSRSSRTSFLCIQSLTQNYGFPFIANGEPLAIVSKRTDGYSTRVALHEGAKIADAGKSLFAEVDETDYEAVNNIFRQLILAKWEYDKKTKAQIPKAESKEPSTKEPPAPIHMGLNAIPED